MEPHITPEISNPDPEYVEILRKQASTPAGSTPPDIASIRAFSDKARQDMDNNSPPLESVEEKEIDIPMRDGTNIAAYIIAPRSVRDASCPVYVAFHGGGWCLGHHKDEIVTHRQLVEGLSMVVVSVGYRLAPEHPFPTGVNDAWDATKWIAENIAAHGGDPSAGFIVGGVSAGANLACVVAHLNRDEGNLLPISGNFLSMPPLLFPPVVPEEYRSQYLSVEQNANCSSLDPDMMHMLIAALKPDIYSPLIVPFNHPNGHSGLPPTYLQICGLDTLRDEAIIYEKVLREKEGVKAKSDMYPGLPHHFWEFFPQLTAQASRRHRDTVEGFRWLLST